MIGFVLVYGTLPPVTVSCIGLGRGCLTRTTSIRKIGHGQLKGGQIDDRLMMIPLVLLSVVASFVDIVVIAVVIAIVVIVVDMRR